MTVLHDRPPTAAIDPIQFRNACGCFATGVTIVTTRAGDRDHGMTANAFMSISLEPALIAVSIARAARLLPLIEASGRFGVSVLAAGTEDLAMHFAGRPNDDLVDPLCDLDGLPVARAATSVFAADVDQAVPAGDHVVFIGRVSAFETVSEEGPLTFYKGRFGKLHEETPPMLDPDWMFAGSHW
ncbi:flavin reductase family protein [Oricola sp.]|uniref:flavin reductase family protein n=1 Tax=Oricola sp. TaxID=1979950 RepID=UPI003BAB86F1